MRRLLIILATIFLTPLTAAAQYLGNVGLQTVTSTPFNLAGCTGSAQTASVQNLGQFSHQAVLAGSSIFALQMKITGSNDNITFTDISDQVTAAGPNATATATGTGYYAVIKISVTCNIGGTFTVKYSGTNGTTGPPLGDALTSAYVKNITFLAPANATLNSLVFRLPTGNTSGTIFFNYNGGTLAGSTVTITCSPNNQMNPSYIPVNLTIANVGTLQAFQIAGNSCPYAVITYNTGGASAANFNLSYALNIPGTSSTGSGAPVVISGGVGVIQPATTFNSESTSAVATAVTKSIAASGSTRVFLYGVTVRCSAGSASVTIKDGVGGTVIWSSDAAFAGTSSASIAWTSAPLASSSGNGMDIVLGSCGGGNTGTLDVQASQL